VSRQSLSPIRVGLVGYGQAARIFHAPLIRSARGLSLCAVSSRDAEKVRADLPDLTVYATADALIAGDDTDLVVVAAPNDQHAPLAKKALAAGKHVVVDKPFTLNLDEARDVLQTAESHQRHVCVFQNRRWDSDYLSIKDVIEGGTLGRIVHFESRIERYRPNVRDRWRDRAGPGSGLLIDLGPHLIDQALQLFGLPDQVLASLAAQRDGAVVDDWAHVVLSYGERRVILIASSLAAGGSARFIVHGARGSAVKLKPDPQEDQLVSGLRPGDPGWGKDNDPLVVFDAHGQARSVGAPLGRQQRFYEILVEGLAGTAPMPVAGIESLAVMAVLEAAFTSAREGRAVRLPLTGEELALWRARRGEGSLDGTPI
jgi:predicted dehydrogenase